MRLLRLLLPFVVLLLVPAVASAAPGGLTFPDGSARCVKKTGADTTPLVCAEAPIGRSYGDAIIDAAIAPDGSAAYLAVARDGLIALQRSAATGALTFPGTAAGCFDRGAGATCTKLPGNRGDFFDVTEVEAYDDDVYAAAGHFIQVFHREDDGTLTPTSCLRRADFAEAACPATSADIAKSYKGIAGSNALRISPNGHWVAHLTQNPDGASRISILARAADGTLTAPDACANVAGDDGCSEIRGFGTHVMQDLAWTPDSSQLVLAGNAGLAVFDVSPSTGVPAQLTGAAGCIVATPVAGCTTNTNAQYVSDAEVTPDGKQVVAASNGTNGGVFVFSREASGALTQTACFSPSGSTNGCTIVPAMTYTYGVLVAPDGQSVYGIGTDDAIIGFARDSSTGVLTRIAGAEGCVSFGGTNGCRTSGPSVSPTAPFMSPDGESVYVAGNQRVVALRRESPPVPDTEAPQIEIRTPPLTKATYTRGQTVIADYSCTDDKGPAGLTCTGTVADGSALDTGTTGVNKRFEVLAKDAAGHERKTVHFYDVIDAPAKPDTRKPDIYIDHPREGGVPFFRGLVVVASYRCEDDVKLATCEGPVASGGRIDTSRLGTFPFTVTASDAAGNTHSVTVPYNVVSPPETPKAIDPVVKASADRSSTQTAKQAPKTAPASPLLAGAALSFPATGPSGAKVENVLAGLLDSKGNVVAAGSANVVSAGSANARQSGAPVVAAGTANLIGTAAGNVVASGSANRARAAAVTPVVVYALGRGVATIGRNGKATVKVKLTKDGKRLLRKAFKKRGKQSVKVTLAAAVTVPGSGYTSVGTRTVTIKE